MNRNSLSEGIILKSQSVFEADRKILFLSPDLGLTEAIVYGTGKGKSRLASGTDLLSAGELLLYLDPVRKQYKVQDMTVKNLFLKIKQGLDKYYTASLWAEIIIKSLGGSESSKVIYFLLQEALELLEDLDSKEGMELLNLQFLWRYLVYQGYTTELGHCSQCGREIAEKEPLYFSANYDPLVCRNCASDKSLFLNPGARRYLTHTIALPIKKVLGICLDKNALTGATEILLLYLETIIEAPLLTRKIAGAYL